jgi:hypothetical protein
MLDRTSSGIKNSHLFHKGKYLVFVEGPDDINFWRIFFPKSIHGFQCKIKATEGGSIQKYLNAAVNNNGKFAVAFDSDYRILSDSTIDYKHPQVVETYMHSIENIMLSPKMLADIIRIKSRQSDYKVENVEAWIDHFNESMYDLMVADCLIQNKKIGIECLGDNCFRFLKNQRAKQPIFCSEKVKDFIEKLNLKEEDFSDQKQKLSKYKPSQHIKGHFFFSASLCFANHEVNRLKEGDKKTHISNEDLYTMLVLACESSLTNLSQLKEIEKKAIIAAEEVVKLLQKF